MAKKRDRYTITGNMSANGISLRGITLVYLGPCNYSGQTKSKTGAKLKKNDLVYRKFRFEDPKEAKVLGLSKDLTEFSLTPQQVSVFLTEKKEVNEL